jgi:hypothetical protein
MSDTPDNWTPEQQAFFTKAFRFFSANQAIMVHPDADTVPQEHWQTTAWNAAWLATIMHGDLDAEVVVTDGDTDEVLSVPDGAITLN